MRPAHRHQPGQREAVEKRHVYVGEEHADIRTAFKEIERCLSVSRFEHVEAGIGEDVGGEHADEGFVLDHQNEGPLI